MEQLLGKIKGGNCVSKCESYGLFGVLEVCKCDCLRALHKNWGWGFGNFWEMFLMFWGAKKISGPPWGQ